MTLRQNICTLISLGAVTVGACTACTPTDASTTLPSYDSLESTYHAVDDLVACLENPPESTLAYNEDGLTTTDSIKCTESVEVFHFDSEASKDEILAILADAEGTVRSAEGQNWFVVDYSDVATSEGSSDSVDLAELAENLGAQYTEVK